MTLFEPASGGEAKSRSADLGRIRLTCDVVKTTESLAAKTRAQLEEVLERMGREKELHSLADQLRMKVRLLREELARASGQLVAARQRREERETSLADKSTLMSNRFQDLKHERETYVLKRRRLEEEKEKLATTKAQLTLRRKQLISEMSSIYPIASGNLDQQQQQANKKNSQLTISDIHLPDAEKFFGRDEAPIGVALGYVSHLLVMISKFLDVPLRYTVVFAGSRSYVYDHLNVNLTEADRLLPLFSKKSGKDKVFYQYAVYLLNHDIAQLKHYLGQTTRDLSQTLPNLLSLLEALFLSDEERAQASATMADSSSSHAGSRTPSARDDFLSREMEYLQKSSSSDPPPPASASSLVSSLSPELQSSTSAVAARARKDSLVSRSLDNGLNEIDLQTRSRPVACVASSATTTANHSLSSTPPAQLTSSSSSAPRDVMLRVNGKMSSLLSASSTSSSQPTTLPLNASNPELTAMSSHHHHHHHGGGIVREPPSLSATSPATFAMDWIARQAFEEEADEIVSRSSSQASSSSRSPGHQRSRDSPLGGRSPSGQNSRESPSSSSIITGTRRK